MKNNVKKSGLGYSEKRLQCGLRDKKLCINSQWDQNKLYIQENLTSLIYVCIIDILP